MKSEQQELRAIEKELNLWDLVVEDVQIWPLIRRSVFSRISESGSQGQIGWRESLAPDDYIKAIMAFSRNIVVKNPYISDKRKIVSIGNGRRKQVDGIYYDIYCDPIAARGELDVLHLERHWRLEHPRPAATGQMRYLDVITHGGAILRALGLLRPKLSGGEQERLSNLQSALEQSFGKDPSVGPIVTSRLHRHKTTLKLFKYLFGKIKPDLLLIVCSYGQETVTEASRSHSIPVVELQHGLIHPDHLGYHFPQDAPVRLFPDYLLVWGEFWRQNADIPLPDDRIIPVGYPWLEQGIDRYAEVTPCDQVLFLSEPGHGNALSRLAIACADAGQISDDIVYKLHPKEVDAWQHTYPWLLDSGVTVIDGQSPSLYELFAQSRAQVGVGSTAVYEGLCFDLETYVYDSGGVRTLRPLVEAGAARRIDSVDALAVQLGRGGDTFDREHYFAADALETMQETLERLMATGTVYDRD